MPGASENPFLEGWASPGPEEASGALRLEEGSRVAVIGGGPAGSFFAYFLLEMAGRLGLGLEVDVFEPRVFAGRGPASCNNCGGIISESLVQILASEGIILPASVVQRGIDSYVMHMDVGSVRIETPLHEMRIAAVARGGGPRGDVVADVGSFDGFLQSLTEEKGARILWDRVDGLEWEDGRPRIQTRGGLRETYDLAVGAVGVNSTAHRLFSGLEFGYAPPATTKTYICEIALGRETVMRHFGNSMHVFLLNLPRLEFAALVPKGEYVTMCMLGEDIDKELIETFLAAPEVRRCLPPEWSASKEMCHCAPRMNVGEAVRPYADRLVLVGDSGVSRLYKDGIGAAYRTAKAAATTAAFHGISAEDFRRHYEPVYQNLIRDNRIGKVVFAGTQLVQKWRFARRTVLRMVSREQRDPDSAKRMSMVLWDTFTGSASYRDIVKRTLRPAFGSQFLWNMVASFWPAGREAS